ncbi:splicing factor, arginine/serine-rich 15-like isoform X2 [Gouania willdenowi]|uniref:splicing factor, arginine/serine-rich 15-like isoform X2 n=1 Tax=Gouania willdenowi TaxID=441366 RepID=UPI00105635F6|nr:splicing factor, arginine/serine-rich 15-like isoform X2 [Gouania willdenowi]
MDAVNAFNMELFSMIEIAPPISRAKMMSVTKSAIKAIKLYKHVVQIVERFIKKCKPELKIPGLYVIDSIVRQSRHQFGIEKDVFGPRFLKNFTETFVNICQCPEDDKVKIMRVLNLWQKNGVFDMDIIQPLMDMANGLSMSPPIEEVPAPAVIQPEVQPVVSNASALPVAPQLTTSNALTAVAKLLQSPHGQELQRMLQSLQQADKPLAAASVNSVPDVPHHTEKRSSLAEKLLDRFDYDDEPEDTTVIETNVQSQGIPENVFTQLLQIANANLHTQQLQQTNDTKPPDHMLSNDHFPVNMVNQSQESSREGSSTRDRHRSYSRRSRSSSRSPRRRRRSRSSSLSRRSRHRRSRSRERRSRERRSRSRERRRRTRSRSQGRGDREDREKDREKDRERQLKGLPSMKNQTLSVCTTTLWVGQLDKKTQQADVMSLLEEFGPIESINMIPPRGCAYIVMLHRPDAYTALNRLSRGPSKVNLKPVKIAWALNKGIKAAHKKFWDVERGVTYIPWSKVKAEELHSYVQGGMLDIETLNPEWNKANEFRSPASVNGPVEEVMGETISAIAQEPPVRHQEPVKVELLVPAPVMLSPPAVPLGTTPFIPADFDPTKHPHGEGVAPSQEPMDIPKRDINPTTNAQTGNHLGPQTGNHLGPQTGNHLGPPTAPPPMLNMPNLPHLQGPRPGMPPMQPSPVMSNPHPFLPHLNIPRLPQQMMPARPMHPLERFRLPMAFAPGAAQFPRRPPMRPEMMNENFGRFFRHERPRFGFPGFPRGRW